MLRTILSAVALTMSLSSVHAAPRNPMGEKADYVLDKSGARTTSMVTDGTATGTVSAYLPNNPQGPSYNVQLNYDVTVRFYGRKQGSVDYPLTDKFFDEDFMVQLRQNGSYETPDYKIRHEGYEDATNMDGSFYAHCDKIRIYDVKVPQSVELRRLFLLAAGLNPDEPSLLSMPIENLQIVGHVFSGVPVLGAVKIDMSGTVQGINAKIGMDLKK